MPGKYIVPPKHRSEAMLVHAAQQGEERAVEHLVLAHPPIRSLVGSLKRQLDRDGRAPDDLESVARVAILEALRSFNPARGARFTTYAYYFIRGAMLKALYPPSERLRENDTVSRIRFVSFDQRNDPNSERDVSHEQKLLSSDPTYGIDPEYARVENADRDKSLRCFVAALPPNQRSITTAVFWEGRTHREVAAERGTSRPAVTRTVQRVLARAGRDLDHEQLQLAA